MTRVRTSLEPSLTSVGAARRFVRDVLLNRQVESSVVDVVELLTSEVVTNALLHALSAEELTVNLDSSCIRIEVSDSSVEPPVRRFAEREAVSGRGLAIVEALALAWGVESVDGGGKRVWFEVGC